MHSDRHGYFVHFYWLESSGRSQGTICSFPFVTTRAAKLSSKVFPVTPDVIKRLQPSKRKRSVASVREVARKMGASPRQQNGGRK